MSGISPSTITRCPRMKRQISRWNFAQARTNPRVAWCEIGSVTIAPIEQMLLIRTKAIQNRIERTRAIG